MSLENPDAGRGAPEQEQETGMTDKEQAVEATTLDLLRSIHPDAWAEITEPNGWSYSTNIGYLAKRAADEIVELQALLFRLRRQRPNADQESKP